MHHCGFYRFLTVTYFLFLHLLLYYTSSSPLKFPNFYYIYLHSTLFSIFPLLDYLLLLLHGVFLLYGFCVYSRLYIHMSRLDLGSPNNRKYRAFVFLSLCRLTQYISQFYSFIYKCHDVIFLTSVLLLSYCSDSIP